MIFTVHHTCSQKGGEKFVLTNAPFLSEYNPQSDKKPFLGEGYYFWDYNIEYAKYWGVSHYSHDKYYVFEADIEIDHVTDGFFLDLAGNRKHLVDFVNLLMEFNLIMEDGTKGIDLCYIINYLRNRMPEDVFPFKVIRAIDYSNSSKFGMRIAFNDKPLNKSFTVLNPRVIITFRQKEDIIYLTKPFITFAS